MEKVILTENIGEFFSLMFKANRGHKMEVTLRMDENTIQIYHKDRVIDGFDYVKIIDEKPTLDRLIKQLSE